jgi:hypothetical protein
MNVTKTVTLTLDDKDRHLLDLIARFCASDLNDRFKKERHLWDLSFSEMHEMEDFAQQLKGL